MFSRLKDSRLNRLQYAKTTREILFLCDDYTEDIKEYFFDRNPDLFVFIMDFYKTGKLHLPDNICVAAFKDELEYFHIDEKCLDFCCSQKYLIKVAEIQDEILKEQEDRNAIDFENYQNCCPEIRKKAWIILVRSLINLILMINKTSIFQFKKEKPHKSKIGHVC
jgi:hypothetical protein